MKLYSFVFEILDYLNYMHVHFKIVCPKMDWLPIQDALLLCALCPCALKVLLKIM